MKPWVHYIPLEEDLSDVREKIQWARDNDEKVQEIVKNASELVAKWVNPELMYCYYAKAFSAYAKRMSRPVQVTDEHEEITHAGDEDLNGNWAKYWARDRFIITADLYKMSNKASKNRKTGSTEYSG